MTLIEIILVSVWLIGMALVVYALLKSAKKGDEIMEEEFNKRRK